MAVGCRRTGPRAEARLVPVSEYMELFNEIGTAYGGDGIGSFGIPNLKAAAPNNTIYYICYAGEI